MLWVMWGEASTHRTTTAQGRRKKNEGLYHASRMRDREIDHTE